MGLWTSTRDALEGTTLGGWDANATGGTRSVNRPPACSGRCRWMRPDDGVRRPARPVARAGDGAVGASTCL